MWYHEIALDELVVLEEWRCSTYNMLSTVWTRLVYKLRYGNTSRRIPHLHIYFSVLGSETFNTTIDVLLLPGFVEGILIYLHMLRLTGGKYCRIDAFPNPSNKIRSPLWKPQMIQEPRVQIRVTVSCRFGEALIANTMKYNEEDHNNLSSTIRLQLALTSSCLKSL